MTTRQRPNGNTIRPSWRCGWALKALRIGPYRKASLIFGEEKDVMNGRIKDLAFWLDERHGVDFWPINLTSLSVPPDVWHAERAATKILLSPIVVTLGVFSFAS